MSFSKYLNELRDGAMRKCIPGLGRRRCQDPEVRVGVGVGAEEGELLGHKVGKGGRAVPGPAS